MAEEPPPQRDWTHLPGLLLGGIMRRSVKLPDFIRFQAVCKPWRQALLLSQPAELQNPHKFRQSLPWLILPCDKPGTADCRGHDCHHFVDVAAEGNNKCRRRLHVDLGRGQYTYPQCLGSAFGWLLIQEQWWPHPLVLYLLNPLTRAKIRLTNKIRHGGGNFRFLHQKERIFNGFLMSAEPAEGSCDVVVVTTTYGSGESGLVLWKLTGGGGGRDEDDDDDQYHHQQCTLVAFNSFVGGDQRFIHSRYKAVLWRDKVYVFCTADGRVLACDLNHHHHRGPSLSWAFLPEEFALSSCKDYYYDHHLTVSPEGELMLLSGRREMVPKGTVPAGLRVGKERRRAVDNSGKLDAEFRKVGFRVYKIDGDAKRWVEVESIGDYALFADAHNVVCVPVRSECRRNCVYYGLDVYELDSDDRLLVRVSDLGDVPDCLVWISPSTY